MCEDPSGTYDILSEGIKWKKPLKNPYNHKMTSEEFLAYLFDMEKGKWEYDYSGDNLGMRIKTC